MGFEQIEHTADVGLHVWADDLPALFSESARAIFDVMGQAAPGAARAARVELEAPDLGALLVDWLSELLWLFEGKGLAPTDVHVEIEDGTVLRADVRGSDAEDFEQHGPAVKAVTYHGLRVVRDGHRWDAIVYLDI